MYYIYFYALIERIREVAERETLVAAMIRILNLPYVTTHSPPRIVNVSSFWGIKSYTSLLSAETTINHAKPSFG